MIPKLLIINYSLFTINYLYYLLQNENDTRQFKKDKMLDLH